MLVVVTGKSGVGKSTILQKSKLLNVIYLDQFVKDTFYKPSHFVYKQIVNQFGHHFVDGSTVLTKNLGKLVFNDKSEMTKLNAIVFPPLKSYLQSIRSDDLIVEMATYINYEKEFKSCFDYVILIRRSQSDLKKFNYLTKPTNPIDDRSIKYDTLINADDLQKATKELRSLAAKIFN